MRAHVVNLSLPGVLGGHAIQFDDEGKLAPWTSWSTALDREMEFYQQCPTDRGYPRFAYVTFLDSEWTPIADRTDTIPATQIGMGIVSYLKFYDLHGKRDVRLLRTACAMGDYLVREALTPNGGRYPNFTRSTGKRDQFPLAADAGSQGDRPFEIEPDKGGIAGFALLMLFEAAGGAEYLAQALQNARVLAANQAEGDATRSPWPFRADHRTGEGCGEISGNMTYILRLYEGLLAQGYGEFAMPRDALWTWILRHQLPSAASGGELFAQFFEDHETPTNRSAWAPLNLARYLLERRGALDPKWLAHAGMLIDLVQKDFTHEEFGITVCHEQDEDKEAWGGINATYGAVLAMYTKATGSASVAQMARLALNFTLYSIDDWGRPRDLWKSAAPGGWQEDAHTDVIHNYVDAIRAFPAWADAF